MSCTIYLSFFFALLSMVGYSIPASGGCKVKSVHQTNDDIQVAVPFAVPVGVPVAPFAPYFYSYRVDQAPAVVNQQSADPSHSPALETQAGRKTALPLPPEPVSQVVKPSSLVTRHCATCHGGEHPQARFSLEHLESLSANDRLKAINAVITGRMPKARRLAPGEVQAAIEELATDHDTKDEPAFGP